MHDEERGERYSACTDYGGKTNETHFLKLVDRDAGLGNAVPALKRRRILGEVHKPVKQESFFVSLLS